MIGVDHTSSWMASAIPQNWKEKICAETGTTGFMIAHTDKPRAGV